MRFSKERCFGLDWLMSLMARRDIYAVDFKVFMLSQAAACTGIINRLSINNMQVEKCIKRPQGALLMG